jgi:tetraacyldisaccharide 4'-kinase
MNESSSVRRLLFPLNPLYRLALAFRELSLLGPARRLRYPVISIGNLSTGGSGKTPLVIALAWALERRGVKVDILSRGYGREGGMVARVDEEGSAEEFGDEPLLMARETGAPVYVALRRYDAGWMAEAEEEAAQAAARAEQQEQARLATEEATGEQAVAPGSAMVLVPLELVVCPPQGAPPGAAGQGGAAQQSALLAEAASPEALPADHLSAEEVSPEEPLPPLVHLLDDGFQHRELARDVDILLLNQQDWQDWLLPAGNLREPMEAARRASVIAIPANEPELEVALQLWGWQKPIWLLHRSMEIPAVTGPVAAFCGIARPEQFFAGIEAAGLQIASRFAFPDHFPYTRAALEELVANAQDAGAHTLLTTEKDLVRMGRLTSLISKSMPLAAVRLRIKIEHQSEAINWLIKQVNSRQTPLSL